MSPYISLNLGKSSGSKRRQKLVFTNVNFTTSWHNECLIMRHLFLLLIFFLIFLPWNCIWMFIFGMQILCKSSKNKQCDSHYSVLQISFLFFLWLLESHWQNRNVHCYILWTSQKLWKSCRLYRSLKGTRQFFNISPRAKKCAPANIKTEVHPEERF